MNIVLEGLVAVHLVLGGMFALVGSIGLVRLPDLMSRLHAPTKATTLGLGGFLIASMLFFLTVNDQFSLHEVLITFFLFITAPITAHFVAKAFMLQHIDPKKELPSTGRELGWGTFAASPETAPQPDNAATHPKT